MQLDTAALETGTYTLRAGLFLDEKDNTPDYFLGSSGDNGSKWYYAGKVQLVNQIE